MISSMNYLFTQGKLLQRTFALQVFDLLGLFESIKYPICFISCICLRNKKKERGGGRGSTREDISKK